MVKEQVVEKFLQNYNIDFTKDNILNFNGIKIPNFYKNKYSFIYNIAGYQQFEFCHSINKIYDEDFFQTGLCCYEIPEVQIKPNDIIFDCGGNFGLFAAYAANKGLQVYSFEPMSLARIYLRQVQKLYSNLTIVPYAVGSENKTEKFIQCDNPAASGIRNSLEFNLNKMLYYEQVNIITLDFFVQQYNIIPNFIKADIEGYEIELLKGMQNIFQYHPKFSISIHKNNIQQLNYIINTLIPKEYNIYQVQKGVEDLILLGVYNV